MLLGKIPEISYLLVDFKATNQEQGNMNFLAHIYLSGEEEEIIVGNFIGDYVKGRSYLDYPKKVSQGIVLHRKIDFYTDQHPVTRKSRNHIIEYYRKYSGIVVDILYDYLLARNWEKYCDIPLPVYVNNVFQILKKHYDVFPQGIKNWFPNFIRNNWLMSYSTLKGVEIVLHRMSSRTSLPEHTDAAMQIFDEKMKEFNQEFNEFFPDIRKYVESDSGIISGKLCDINIL